MTGVPGRSSVLTGDSGPPPNRVGLANRIISFHGDYGVEAQFCQNEEFLVSHRFDRRLDPMRTPRGLAIQWAEAVRKDGRRRREGDD
jgi:hypothetical protein